MWDVLDGEDGRLPPTLPRSEFGVYVPEEGWTGREPTSVVAPGRGGLSFLPIMCGGDCSEYPDHAAGGGGGGGFGGTGQTGADAPGALFGNGTGGLDYGRHWFLGEATDDGLLYGGSGGGGGGASTNTLNPDDEVAVPGTGGGGGGGCLVLTVGGDLTIGPEGKIDATGGDAFKTVYTGGSGGGGSGGSVLLRVNGNLEIAQGSIITAEGGGANLAPPAVPAGYEVSPLSTGGAGAPGRIRIEYPGAGLASGDTVLVFLKPEGVTASVGTAFNGSEVVSWVWSDPIPLAGGSGNGLMLVDGVVDVAGSVVQLLDRTFASSIVRWSVLIDGGEARCSGRPGPDRMFGPMEEFELGAVGLKPTYVRFLIGFVASMKTEETAEVDVLSIPWTAVDYMPPPPEPEPEPEP
jgi:hypothetical protein